MTKESKNTQLAKLSPQGEAIMALGDADPRFLERYGARLKHYAEVVPTPRLFGKILDRMMGGEDEEIAYALAQALEQTQGNKTGMFAEEETTVFPELRIFHGAGNDPNRPDDCKLGTFYINTKEKVGPEFVGAVIAIWKGRTMWGDRNAGESTSAPLCQSMNRIVGTTCGECKDCPDEPWKHGERTRCDNDVVAFMLSKDYTRIILVRFQKSSVKAGEGLTRSLKVSPQLWTKWWRLTLEKQTKDSNTWYSIVTQPATVDGQPDAEYTPEAIDEFCEALSNSLTAGYILPGMARAYTQSARAAENATQTPTGSGDAKSASPDDLPGDDESKYGEMPDDDAPDV